MKELILLVAPPGAGKSSLATTFITHAYVNQDSQGKEGHWVKFVDDVVMGRNIIVDRLNHLKDQRNKYLSLAKEYGYTTRIIVLHVSSDVCMSRCLARTGHQTITTPQDASRAIDMFFRKYERVQDNEADVVERRGWDGPKDLCIITDLDGTLADLRHRLHFVNGTDNITERKKDWKSFFKAAPDDAVHEWCRSILDTAKLPVVVATARPDEYKKDTKDWLDKHGISYNHMVMRRRNDYRHDTIVKEMMLEFELLPKYNILFWLDDRGSVIKMLRSHGVRVLDCQGEDF